MSVSGDPQSGPVTVEQLAASKMLPIDFLADLGIRDVKGGVEIFYGNGNRVRVRTTVSASGSKWGEGSSPIVPYGVFRPHAEDYRIVVEGESDCWALWYHELPALGIPGVSMTKVLMLPLLVGVRRIYVVAEPDQAGQSFPAAVADRMAEVFRLGAVIGVRVDPPEVMAISMPEGVKDPADLHVSLQGDRDAFLATIHRAIDAAQAVDSANSANTAIEEWEPPVPLTSFDPPPFPTGVLPDWMRNFVEAEATATQTPPDLAAMLGLSAAAAAVARRAEIEVKDGWREPLNIYTATVQPSGSRKSAVFRDATAPIESAEETAVIQAMNEIAVATEERKILDGQLKAARREAISGDGDSDKARDLAAALAGFHVPRTPRLLADDVTAERLEALLAEQGGRMAIFAAEGDVFDILAGRYSSSGVVNLGVFLKAHAGDHIRVDRVGRGSVIVRHPALTIGLAVQPDVIDGLASRREFRGRGLTPRFLYSLPESNVGRRAVDPPPVPPTVRNEYEAHLTSLLSIGPTADTEYHPHVLQFDEAGREALLGFAAELEPELAQGGELGTIAEWGSKLVGAVARIAGILHLADHATEPTPWEIRVSADVVHRAILIGRYLIPHALAAFALMGADPAVADARHILATIERREWTEFTIRDLFEATKSRYKKVDQMTPGLNLLIDHEYIRLRDGQPRRGRGRPPSPTFDVNPATYSQKSQKSQKPDRRD